MDPAMAGQPPMDPSMMGGAPPMDPSMMGGAPPIMLSMETLQALIQQLTAGQDGSGGDTARVTNRELGERLDRQEVMLGQIMSAMSITPPPDAGAGPSEIPGMPPDLLQSLQGVPDAGAGAPPPGDLGGTLEPEQDLNAVMPMEIGEPKQASANSSLAQILERLNTYR